MPMPSRLDSPSLSERSRHIQRSLDERPRRVSGDGGVCRVCLAGLWGRACGPRRARRLLVAALPRECSDPRAIAATARPAAMTRKQQRLGVLALGMAALGGATALVLSAFNDNMVFFYSPSELKAKAV